MCLIDTSAGNMLRAPGTLRNCTRISAFLWLRALPALMMKGTPSHLSVESNSFTRPPVHKDSYLWLQILKINEQNVGVIESLFFNVSSSLYLPKTPFIKLSLTGIKKNPGFFPSLLATYCPTTTSSSLMGSMLFSSFTCHDSLHARRL